uniref:Biogenesis of lysosome-related organelles complex 1 subunit 1 n=1 Tax=Rattus norvegicus TaxID=10116 RepID=A0A8I5ZQV1_RAT
RDSVRSKRAKARSGSRSFREGPAVPAPSQTRPCCPACSKNTRQSRTNGRSCRVSSSVRSAAPGRGLASSGSLDLGVAQAYMNQRKLDHEVKTLQVQAAQFAKQTGQWIGMVENFNQALKEIGDVENWARSIELDMRTIATALEYVYKGQLQSAPS